MHTFSILKRKYLNVLLLLLVGATLLVLFQGVYIPTGIYRFFYTRTSINCYRVKTKSLPDITDEGPRKGKSIFFHETSCNSFFNGKISITARQACAVESAAKMNPNLDVYLLFTSPGVFQFEGSESDEMLKSLLSYENVKIKHLDYEKYTRGTPVENLYKNGLIDSSSYAQSHASDVLRYLTLWKYGGIYLDLDVVVIKSLENLPPNYAGSESEKNVAAGVLNFAATGIGHELARNCLIDLKDHFDGRDWGYNGPGVITRLLKTICGAKQAKDMITKDCQGFKVYPTDQFYAIPWWNWKMYFKENSTEAVQDASKNSYVIHVWNKHSAKTKIPLTAEVPYLSYARKYCPKVIGECKEVF